MKLWGHNYHLFNGRTRHAGILLKFEFYENVVGYSCLHPWPELGDLTLEGEIKSLMNAQVTPAFFRAMNYAQIDGDARSQGKNLFENLKIPKSHYLISSLDELTLLSVGKIAEKGFELLKIKCGDDPEQELKALNEAALVCQTHKLKMRLDFNGKLSFEEAKTFLQKLSKSVGHLNFIDFIEDISPFNGDNWKAIKNQFGVKLALDREIKNLPSKIRRELIQHADVLILKPTIQNPAVMLDLALNNGMKMVVTTNLDHSLGVMAAALEAGRLQKAHGDLILPCGLISHGQFDDDGFFSKIKIQGTEFKELPSVGLGFEEELKKIKWNFLV